METHYEKVRIRLFFTKSLKIMKQVSLLHVYVYKMANAIKFKEAFILIIIWILLLHQCPEHNRKESWVLQKQVKIDISTWSWCINVQIGLYLRRMYKIYVFILPSFLRILLLYFQVSIFRLIFPPEFSSSLSNCLLDPELLASQFRCPKSNLTPPHFV